MADLASGSKPQLDFEGAPLVGVAASLYEDLDDVRYHLALRTAEAYSANRVPLIIVDASPTTEVGDELSDRGAEVLVPDRPGLATQYIEGVEFALNSGATNIVRHEPEKVGLITFRTRIIEALRANDIVVIGRTEKAMSSLPSTQARVERLAGWLFEKHLELPPDTLSGGRAYTNVGAGYLLNYDVEKYGNNWLHLYYPLLAAIRDGVAVGGIQIDLMHPAEMTAQEEGNPLFDTKRHDQFMLQVEALLGEVGYHSK